MLIITSLFFLDQKIYDTLEENDIVQKIADQTGTIMEALQGPVASCFPLIGERFTDIDNNVPWHETNKIFCRSNRIFEHHIW